MESDVHSLLHGNCYHQIIQAKLNLKIDYPSPYEREILHYQKANRKYQRSDRSVSMGNAFYEY